MITECLIALLVYLEAGNQSFEGKQTVANVVYNRGGNPVVTALKPRQFSSLNNRRYIKKHIARLTVPMFTECLKATLYAYVEDKTGGAIYYDMAERKPPVRNCKFIKRIEGHKFYGKL